MPRAAIQLYTLRDVDLPFDDLLRRVADAGFEGVEFAYRVTEEDPEAVVDTLDETGLDVAGAHVGIEGLEEDLEEAVAFYEALGCEDVVVPWLGASCFDSPEAVAATVERLSTIESDLEDRGIDLHYHNHDHEFVDLDGRFGFDLFVEESEIGIELDLGSALLGGDDPVVRLEDLGDRAPLVHLKDVDCEAGESVPVGEGDLDVAACAETFREQGGEWLIYEYEGENPLDSLDEAAATVRENC